jgi:hypothetical protein
MIIIVGIAIIESCRKSWMHSLADLGNHSTSSDPFERLPEEMCVMRCSTRRSLFQATYTLTPAHTTAIKHAAIPVFDSKYVSTLSAAAHVEKTSHGSGYGDRDEQRRRLEYFHDIGYSITDNTRTSIFRSICADIGSRVFQILDISRQARKVQIKHVGKKVALLKICC